MLDSRTLRAHAAPSAPTDWAPRSEDVTRVRRTLRRRDRRELRETLRRDVLALVGTD
jgi:hypothetical protein